MGYIWDVSKQDPKGVDLYSIVKDPENSIHRLAEMIKETLVFVLAGTDPDQEVICETMEKAESMPSAGGRSPAKRKKKGGR